MSKYDDYVQPEEETEMLIYEEWLSYVDEVNLAREEDWEDWVKDTPTTDQGGHRWSPLSYLKIEDPCLTDSQ